MIGESEDEHGDDEEQDAYSLNFSNGH